MKTQKINTRFMNGNKDVEGEIFSLLCSEYGTGNVLNSEIDFDNAIYSDNFIFAIESGLIPVLELKPSFEAKKDAEYHHLIINDECFVMYFNN